MTPAQPINWNAALNGALILTGTMAAYLLARRYGIEGYWPLAVFVVAFPLVAIFGTIGCVGFSGALVGGIGMALLEKPRGAVGGRK